MEKIFCIKTEIRDPEIINVEPGILEKSIIIDYIGIFKKDRTIFNLLK